MKLKTEQEIKTLSKGSWDEWKSEDDFEFDGDYYQDGYANGYSQAQQDLLASASESFEKWKDCLTPGGSYQVNRLDLHEKTWQAAKLSSAKELEELKKKAEDLTNFWEPFIEKLKKDKSSYAPHRTAMDALTSAFDIHCENEDLKKENESLQLEVENLREFIAEHDMNESLQEWNNCN